MKIKNGKGFTLIELMIVVAIIGILAAIAIPRFAQMVERAKEGATAGNLSAIRGAVHIYYSKNDGVYPDTIASDSPFVGPAETNYMKELPKATATPLGNTNAVTVVASGAPTTTGQGWRYASTTGDVWANSTALDTRGRPFSSY
jgi:type IV pilus assembly protein PilA